MKRLNIIRKGSSANIEAAMQKSVPSAVIKKVSRLHFSLIISVILVGMLICLKVSTDAQIAELCYENSTLTNSLSKLDSELTKLNVDVTKRVNVRELEMKAKTELGLTKIEKHQIEYVNINVDNKIESIKQEESDGIFDAIGRSFSTLLEFLS